MRILFFALFLISSGVVSAQMLPDSTFIRIASDAGVQADGYDRLKKACGEIGHRLTGSENAVRAEQLLHDAFLKKGLSRVEFFSFPIRIWKRNSCQLEVVPKNSDHFVAVKSVSLANAASGTGMWHLVDGSDGLESDLSAIAPNIRGNCLLMNLDLSRRESGRRNLHRAEKVSLALRYGAAAVLFVHPREAQMVLTGTASLNGDQVPVPAVCIPGKQGKEIRDWMKTHSLMAEIKVKNDISEGKARNVMGWVEAPVPTRETIVVCGHLDSWDLGTGAVDNGIGSFTIPDIAGALQKKRSLLRRNVCFLLTMGEEQGLLGSRALVAQWQKEGKLGDVKAVVNLDMTGNPQAINDFDWPGAADFFKITSQKIRSALPGFSAPAAHEPGLHSDHQPFMLEGIPSFSMTSSMPDSVYHCYHADCDNINLVQDFYMKNSAIAHSVMVLDLASRKQLGFARMKPKKLANWLKSHKLKEKLEISGEWKWN